MRRGGRSHIFRWKSPRGDRWRKVIPDRKDCWRGGCTQAAVTAGGRRGNYGDAEKGLQPKGRVRTQISF